MSRPRATMLLLALVAPASARAQTATDIHLLRLEPGAAPRAVGPPVAVTDRDGYDNQPAFTPDGHAIVYTSIRDGQADTYRHELTGGASLRVTRTPESEYSPTPIPGTDRFSVVRVEADSTQRLWSFAADGTDPRLVLDRVAPVGYHAWAPDGRRVALFILGEPASLHLADTRTGQAVRVAADIGRSIQPVPGRAAISFTQRIGDRWWIRELDLDSRTVRPVAPLPHADAYHAWTPGGALLSAIGTSLLRRSTEGTGDWIRMVDVAGWGLGPVSRLAVSPDGRHLAIVVERGAH